ncbi:MAG: zinc ribbon domain-containing protein [Longicatena sp.]
MDKIQYVCVKCGNSEFVSDQIQTTGGDLAKLFDVQNKKFITISCAKCGYTELYKEQSDDALNILDLLTSN